MAQSSGEPKFSLRLIVDKEKNKVVLAEASGDFVNVLFNLLQLPMGTIVRLLEEHRKLKPVTVGCLSNIYRSVVDMNIDDFETEACKQMLLYPRSMKQVKRKWLKPYLNPTGDLKFFKCPDFYCLRSCSNFSSTSLCLCGKLMSEAISLTDEDNIHDTSSGVFVSGRSSFLITDDLQVAVRSTDIVLKILKSLSCDLSKLEEKLVYVGFEEVLTLLECIFSSNAPLTDTFLNKQNPQSPPKIYDSPSPLLKIKGNESEPETVVNLSAIVRKQDMQVLYVECGEDFIDLLFTFLAIPSESALDISGNSFPFGCIGNLLRSYKDLSATQVSTSKCVLPYYYRCQKQMLDIIFEQHPLYYQLVVKVGGRLCRIPVQRLTRNPPNEKNPVVVIDPKSRGRDESTEGSGFVKRGTKFTVTDGLIIAPMNSSSTLRLLKKFKIQAEDLEVQEISITKKEATRLLGASLATSSALTTVLRNLIVKKPKQET